MSHLPNPGLFCLNSNPKTAQWGLSLLTPLITVFFLPWDYEKKCFYFYCNSSAVCEKLLGWGVNLIYKSKKLNINFWILDIEQINVWRRPLFNNTSKWYYWTDFFFTSVGSISTVSWYSWIRGRYIVSSKLRHSSKATTLNKWKSALWCIHQISSYFKIF